MSKKKKNNGSSKKITEETLNLNTKETVETDAMPSEEEQPTAEKTQPAENEQSPVQSSVKSAAVNPTLAKIKTFFEKCGLPDMLMVRLFAVYFFISGINISSMKKIDLQPIEDWKKFITEISFGGSILLMAMCFITLSVVYWAVPKKFKFIDIPALFIGIMIFALNVTWRINNFYVGMSVGLVAAVFISYMMKKVDHSKFEKIPDWAAAAAGFTVAAAVMIFVAFTTIHRYKTFGVSTFDFGIFAQMYHNMADDLSAVTSCERNKLLSHFYVHASYIYYLLLPVYKIFPEPTTLLAAQAFLALGGVVPLYLIAKKHDYHGFALLAVCMVYTFFEGILAPCYYDFHENCFLPTLLMWLLYAMDSKKTILFYIMSVLVCIVKEDAPLYVICIAVYFLISEKSKKRLHGLIIAALSGVYFFYINNWLSSNGDGQMMVSTRFGNLTINPDDGFMGIIKNVISNPGYFFNLFVEEETLLFFIQVMIPILFLPFMTRKIERFILMIPFIIMNLVVGAGYGYAANIGYQYIFGPSALLIYLCVINADEFKREQRNTMFASAAVLCILTSISLLSNNISSYESYKKDKQRYDAMDDCLSSIPEDGSVLANTWYTAHTSNRREVYIFDDEDFITNNEEVVGVVNLENYDFFAMSRYDDNTDKAIPVLESAGWTIYDEVEGWTVIYVNPQYLAEHN